ncbi:MAG: thiamine-phosphate kinase [Dehalococcoidia bacterium]|nr:thiamine-phosphate kinase [Dehalococcoidia bacterium]
MKLTDVGEFDMIDQLAKIARESCPPSAVSRQNLTIGIGDDAAAWQNESGRTLATTDCLIEGIHFTKAITDWHDLGWKALAVNFSDIAAMGGHPRYALVTLGLPEETSTEDVLQFYTGMAELANRYETAIIGGDVSAAPAVFINLAVTGRAGKHLLTRNMARPGDVVAVTGSLGGAAGGLRILQAHRKPSEIGKALCEAFLRPCPRLEEGTLLVAEGVRCAIDLSDGLATDLKRICQQSSVGAVVEVAMVPLPPMLTALFGTEALALALGGGEDYELLFTAPIKTVEQVAAKAPCPVTIIGRVTTENPGKLNLISPDGQDFTLDNQGWQHFAHRT